MRKTTKKLLFSAIVTACIAVGGAATTADFFQNANAGNVVWSALETPIETEYDFGTTFSVPERTLTVNGQEILAKSVVVYPNGTATTESNVKLDVGGTYVVRYTAQANGKTYMDESSFWVTGAQVSVQSSKSSFFYGAYNYDVNRTKLVDATTGATENTQYTYTCESGLMVRLAHGDTLTFHQPIDIKNVTSADSLIKAFATPNEQGTPDFEKLVFTFTDVYNPNITLRFISQHTAEGYDYRKTYSRVAGNGQKDSGVDFMDANRIYVGQWGTSGDGSYTRRFKTIYQNESTGAWVDDYKEQDEMPIDFRYDWQTKSAYLRDYRNATRVNLIADMDNPEHFDSLWSGFTSGKVRLSITADIYSSETANFCVTNVYGLDMQQTEYTDTQAPAITVNTDYEEMPKALVGGKYPVPTATAFDLNIGSCLVKTSVWYNYTSANPKSVSIENGWFCTDKYGDYAIVYEATDGNGNKAQEVLWVRAENTLPPMTVEVSADRTESGVCGEWIMPAAYEVENAIGLRKDVTVRVQAKYDDETFDVANGFRPEKAGEYEIVYTAVDYIGREKQASYVVTIENGDLPLFVDTPYLPPAYVSGMQYTMPKVYANDYSSGTLVRKLAYAEVTDDNSTYRVEGGAVFTPVVAQQGDIVKVVFKCEDVQSQTYYIPATVSMGRDPVTNRTRLFVSNYLHGDGFTTNATAEYTTVEATTSDGYWKFANTLLAQNFSLKLRGVKNASKYDGLTITIADWKNPNQRISVYAQNLNDSVMFYVGNETLKLNNALNDGGGFTVKYSYGEISVDSSTLALKTYDDGQPFNGFDSELITLCVSFDNATIGAKYALEEINGQTIVLTARDGFSPNIVVSGDYGGLQTYGSTVTLPRANAADVLDPNVSFLLTVKRPNGTVAKDVKGNLLENVDPKQEYTLRMEAYGQYMVCYTAQDSVGNANNWSYPLIVKDEIAPTVSFSGSFVDRAEVGDTLVIPNFTVKDNVTESKNLIVNKYIYTPSGKVYALSETGNSIICSQVGEYELRVTVVDAEGNIAMYTHTVTVVEKTATEGDA